MKKNIKYFVFFILILSMGLGILFLKPSNAFLFQNAKGDCAGRGMFMYNALYRDTSNADIVLFGSSKTMNDINDSLMTSLSKKRFLNMGYCRFGRNIDYFFIEEYCKTHHPGKIVLEVRQEEGGNLHPLSAFLLPLPKIIEDTKTFKFEIFQNLYNKWLCNLKYLRGMLFDDQMEEPAWVSTDHGFWFGNKITDIQPLIKKRYSDSVEFKQTNPATGKLNINSAYYFNKLKALCEKDEMELCFLYLPSYGNVSGRPLQAKDYERFGKVLIPPDSIVKNVVNFSDFGHLNKRGADLISLWLLAQLGHGLAGRH